MDHNQPGLRSIPAVDEPRGSQHVWDVDVAEAETALAEGRCMVDVREPAELVEARLPGTLHIPMGQLLGRLGELDATQPVYVLCRTGRRSGVVTEALRARGYEAWNVAGGLAAWAQSGRPYDSGPLG